MTTLGDLDGSRWAGTAELWLDPLGNEVETSDCTMTVVEGELRYTWSYGGEPQSGRLRPTGGAAEFEDTWHSPAPMACTRIERSSALLEALGTYSAGDGPPWGWGLTLSLRPSGELVLQMTNVTPWGEHGRAVRMICTRTD